MTKPLIAVVVPYRERFEPSFFLDTWLPLYEYRKSLDWCTLAISKGLMSDMPHVSAARNALVRAAMDRGVDFIYWLDADITVESPRGSVEALRMLHEAIREEGVGIVSGLFPAKNSRRPCAYIWNESSGRYDLMDYGDFSGGLREVDAVGMGCVLMKAEIFGRLDPPWFKCDDEYEDYGEDIGFCRRAKEAGFGIVVHPGVVLGHLGIFKLTVEGALEKPV